mgnify:CR=1 FL=1
MKKTIKFGMLWVFLEQQMVYSKDSEAPFSSDGMVTFAQAIREGKMDIHTKDFTILTGDTPISVRYMFDHQEEFQIGERHSQDK